MKPPPPERYSFDLWRIFFGDQPPWFLLEVLFRTTVIYVYTLVLIRLLGKRGLGQLSPFDFVIVIALGSAVGDPMFYADVPLVHTMAVITIVVLLQRVVSVITERSRTAQRWIDSEPRRLVHRGVVDLKNLRNEQLESEELYAALRIQGIQQLGEVELAYIEPSGTISVLRTEQPAPGRPLLAHTDPDFPRPHLAGEQAPRSDRYACSDCGTQISVARHARFPARCSHCPCSEWIGISKTVYAPSHPTR